MTARNTVRGEAELRLSRHLSPTREFALSALQAYYFWRIYPICKPWLERNCLRKHCRFGLYIHWFLSTAQVYKWVSVTDPNQLDSFKIYIVYYGLLVVPIGVVDADLSAKDAPCCAHTYRGACTASPESRCEEERA